MTSFFSPSLYFTVRTGPSTLVTVWPTAPLVMVPLGAPDAFTRATTSALSLSFSVTGPLADLMYNVLPSTLSRVPATRWVGCCAHAVETANTAAKAAAVIIRIVLISVLPMGYRAAEHTAVSPDGEEAQRGVKFLNSRD